MAEYVVGGSMFGVGAEWDRASVEEWCNKDEEDARE
jgi:hypothetical protein